MIGTALMDRVLEHVARASAGFAGKPGASDEALLRGLRQAFGGVQFSVCRDDDVPSRISCAAQNGCCRLYYVAAGDHCLSLTNDVSSAGGLVIALLEQDEE